jgi:hypothetical protein
MHDYLITFELSAPLDQYPYLSFKLATLRAQPIEHNTWRVSVDEDAASELTADLSALLRDNDRLSIVSTGPLNPKQPF